MLVPSLCPKAIEQSTWMLSKGSPDSIQAIGLQHPITVRRADDGECVLIAGQHRLEAYKRLGLPKIAARIMEERSARLWSISENLHRVDQSQLDRADAIASYAKERGLLEAGPRAQPGGKQPNDRGNSRTARALRINRKQERQARKHAGICKEAKTLLRLNGLDNSVKALNFVAGSELPAEQVAQVKILIKSQKTRSDARPRAKSSPKGGTPSRNGLAITASFLELKRQWKPLAFRKNFENATPEVRKRFVDKVLRTVS
jgi:ParB family chromosome partitioning protein